jgi:hypothetical protein
VSDIDEAEVKKPLTRVGHLRTVGACASEMARVYRAVRRGQLSSLEGFRLAAILTQLRACIESNEVEQRLEELERQALSRRPMLLESKGSLQ